MNDDVVTEILSRLPAKAVLRCRAVCRSWRRITTSSYFVAAHCRRRPLQVLAYTGPNNDGSSQRYSYSFTVTSVPIAAVPAVYDGDDTECRRLLRRDMRLSLRGSCDGLLLFQRTNTESMLICNPATRQLVNLPPVSTDSDDRSDLLPSAFYFHRPSGEYRVLCYRKGTNYILSTGSGEPRRLGPVPDHQHRMCSFSCMNVGETFGESVYWGRCQTDDCRQMMAFDTVSEKFRQVAPPPPVHQADEGPLFDMHGTLALTAISTKPDYLDVWTAEDAAGERWVRRLRVQLPRPRGYFPKVTKPYGIGMAAMDDAGVLLVTMCGRCGFVYDTKCKRMVSYSHRGRSDPWHLAYRESLVTVKPCSTPELPPDGEPWLTLLSSGTGITAGAKSNRQPKRGAHFAWFGFMESLFNCPFFL